MRAGAGALTGQWRTLLVGVLSLAGLSCARAYRVRLQDCPVSPAPTAVSSLHVQYLGVGGFLLRYGGSTVLTAPLYSNPGAVELLTDQRIGPDPSQIERLPDEADAAAAILVGHAHYDHLMDVPYVALHRAGSARIVGSRTTRNLLAAWPALATRVVCVDATTAGCERPLTWFAPQPAAPAVRVMALPSAHSAQVTLQLLNRQPEPMHLWRGVLSEPASRAPRSASDWVEGEVFAYVIDFLAPSGGVAFRVYYQDSGTDEGMGFVPEAVVSEKRVDVALLCVGGDFERLRKHPEGIIRNTRARFVVLGHWEDFFVTQDNHTRDGAVYAIPTLASADRKSETGRFIKRAARALHEVSPGSQPLLPCPTLSRFTFPPNL